MKKFTGVLLVAAAMLIAFTFYTLSEGEETKKESKMMEKTSEGEAMTAMVGIGKPAPDFSLMGADGKTHKLSDYAGKWVVLEWVNPDCPFVRKQYNSHNMQNLQAAYVKKGVVWLTICSSAPDKQGYYTGDELNTKIKAMDVKSTAYLVDADGTVGKMYEAKTTPDMYVISPKGVLIYAGAIDDKPSTKIEDIEGAHNYVQAALEAGMAGKDVEVASTTSYGCSVKY